MFSIARTNFAARLSCAAIGRTISVILLSVVLASRAFAQESPTSHTGAISPLSELLAEAEKNNPQIEAARQGWQAAKQVPTQVSTLPDPQFTLQHFSVGSPRPFAGYTNSEFAYIGLGVSQDIPYPGKLRLKGEIAKREADVSQQQVESVRRSVLAELKAAYFQNYFALRKPDAPSGFRRYETGRVGIYSSEFRKAWDSRAVDRRFHSEAQGKRSSPAAVLHPGNGRTRMVPEAAMR